MKQVKKRYEQLRRLTKETKKYWWRKGDTKDIRTGSNNTNQIASSKIMKESCKKSVEKASRRLSHQMQIKHF